MSNIFECIFCDECNLLNTMNCCVVCTSSSAYGSCVNVSLEQKSLIKKSIVTSCCCTVLKINKNYAIH